MRDGDLLELQDMTQMPPTELDQHEAMLRAECQQIADMLSEKNRAYGDSALNPIRIFAQSDAIEQIRVRIDDKLSRLKRGKSAGEDVIFDLIGYLVLLRIAMKKQAAPLDQFSDPTLVTLAKEWRPGSDPAPAGTDE